MKRPRPFLAPALLSILPGHRQALAVAIDIEQKRAQARALEFDIDPVLEDARRITSETPLPWHVVWPQVWILAWDAACRGETPPRFTVNRRLYIVPVEVER